MTKSNFNFDRRDKQNLYEEIFDITTGHNHDGTDSRTLSALDVTTGHDHDGTDSKLIPYMTYKAGYQSDTNATIDAVITIPVAAMRASDVVLANVVYYETVSYIITTAMASTAAITVTMNTNCGKVTIAYAVLRAS